MPLNELGPYRVRVNAVRPGLVPTNSSAALVLDEQTCDDYLARMPLGRTGTPDEIADAVRFLAGPEPAWITGQIIAVDGGHTLRRGPTSNHLFATHFDDELDLLMKQKPPEARAWRLRRPP